MTTRENIAGARIRPLLPGLLGLALFLLAAGYGHHALREVVDNTDQRKQTRMILVGGVQVFSLLKDVETGQRGYLLTGDPAYLAPYDQALAQLPGELAALRRGVSRDFGAGRMDVLDKHIARRLAIAEEILDLRRSRGAEPARQQLLAGESKAAMDVIRAEFAGLDTEIDRRLETLDAKVLATQDDAITAGVLLATLAVMLLALAYALLLREQRRRMRAEQALTARADELARLRGAELESVFEALPDLFFRLAPDGTILDFRGRLADLYLPPERFLGKRMRDVLPPEVGAMFTAQIKAVLASAVPIHPAFEYVLPMPEGERHYEARLSRLPERAEVVAVVRDIEERHQAEATIRKWADAFEHCAHGIALGNARTNRLMACNPALGALLGWAPEDLMGRPILDIYAPAEHARLRARIAEVDTLGKVRYEADMLRRDGGTVPVQLDLVAVRGEDGVPLYRVATIQDIRERRSAMTALEHARDDLRAFARKLDEDIEGERKRLAREVHDQLGQIFTALKLNLLARAPGAPLDAARVEEFGALLDEGVKVARRISADLRPPMLDDLGLGPALVYYGQALGKRANCAVEVDIQHDARLGPEYANQLFRVAQEALTNVARHAGATRVRVVGAVEDGHYLLSVEDDGRGLAPEQPGGLGMLGMRERAALIGAKLEMGVSPLGGMRLTARLPLIEGEEDDAHAAGG